jgi:hypothetical protein
MPGVSAVRVMAVMAYGSPPARSMNRTDFAPVNVSWMALICASTVPR